MAVDVLSLVGLPDSTHYSQSFHFNQDQYDISIVLNFCGEKSAEIIKQCLEYIKKNVPFSAESVYNLVQNLIEKYEHDGVLECSIVLKNRHLIISAAYNGSVGLVRNKKIGFLISSKETIQLVEGKWKTGDYYCIATAGTLKTVDELLARLQQGFDPVNTVSISAPSFHENVSRFGGAIRVITFDEEFEAELPFIENAVYELQSSTTKENEKVNLVNEPQLPKNTIYTLIKNKLPVQFLQNILHFVHSHKKRTLALTIIISILTLLCVTTIFIYFQARNEKINALRNRLEPLQTQLVLIKESDNQNTFETKDAVSRIIQDLQTIKAETEKVNYLQKIIDADIEEASTLFDTAADKNVIETVPIFFDLREIRNDFIASDMTIVGRELALIDTETKSLVLLSIDSKEGQLIGINAEKAINLATSDKRLLILTNGIQQIDREKNETSASEIIKTDEQITTAAYIGAYENYAYVVNKTKRNIYRYLTDSGSESKPTSWLKSAKGLDFDTITDIAIDGKVWISTNKGEIYSFLQGIDQPFAIAPLSPALESALKIYTTVESEQLYVLEPKQKRVIILKKNGDFVKEVQNETFASASDIAVDERTNKIFVLNGSLIVELSITD